MNCFNYNCAAKKLCQENPYLLWKAPVHWRTNLLFPRGLRPFSKSWALASSPLFLPSASARNASLPTRPQHFLSHHLSFLVLHPISSSPNKILFTSNGALHLLPAQQPNSYTAGPWSMSSLISLCTEEWFFFKVCASESLNNAHRGSSLARAATKFLKTLPTQVLFFDVGGCWRHGCF